MDIHKPKPVHGWKEFLGELGVVVLGISIALLGEQGVEALHWREQVASANEALAGDMAAVVSNAAERDAFSACIDKHLVRWSDMIEEGARTGHLPPQGAMHRAPRRLWLLNSWDGLVASGIAPHLPRDQLFRISHVAFYLRMAQDADVDEDIQWTRLYTMVGPGRPVDAAELADLRMALSRATADAKGLRLSTLQIKSQIDATGLLPKDKEKQLAASAKAFASTHCVPDEPIPARYGDGPPAGQPLSRPLGG